MSRLPPYYRAVDAALEADVRAVLAENLVLAPRYAATPYWRRLANDANRLFQQFLTDPRAVDPAELSAMYHQTEAGQRWRMRRYGEDVVAEPRARRLDVLARMGRVLGVDVTAEAHVSHVERLYTLGEAAQVLRKSPNTLQRLLHDGELAGRKIGGTWRIPSSELERLTQGSIAHEGLSLDRQQEAGDVSSPDANHALRKLIASLPVPVVAFDSELRITAVNAGVERLFGYSAGELIGASNLTLRPADPELRERRWRQVAERGACTGTAGILDLSDRIVLVHIRCVAVHADHAGVAYLSLMTPRRRRANRRESGLKAA